MVDCLDILKEKFKINSRAYMPHVGIIDLEGYAAIAHEEFFKNLHLADSDSICLIVRAVENISSSMPVIINQDNGLYTEDEWVEGCCWSFLKQPRIFAKKWGLWFNNCFDILDRDRDGYITTEEFNICYQLTNRRNDKEFMSRAFAAIDTGNAGKLSKDQYVTAYITYFTDPNITHTDLPLF